MNYTIFRATDYGRHLGPIMYSNILSLELQVKSIIPQATDKQVSAIVEMICDGRKTEFEYESDIPEYPRIYKRVVG